MPPAGDRYTDARMSPAVGSALNVCNPVLIAATLASSCLTNVKAEDVPAVVCRIDSTRHGVLVESAPSKDASNDLTSAPTVEPATTCNTVLAAADAAATAEMRAMC